jgi:hypothetical protein
MNKYDVLLRLNRKVMLTPEQAAEIADMLQELERLKHHYDNAAPEHNLLALLDLYEERKDEAEAELADLRARIERAKRFSVTYHGDEMEVSEIDVDIEDVQPGETRRFKLVEVERDE